MTKMIDTTLPLEAAGPAGNPVLNNLRCLVNPVGYLLDQIQRFPSSPVVPVTNRNGSFVVLRGAEAVKQFFTDNETFHRVDDGTFQLPTGHPWSNMFDNVLTANGDDHKRRRKLLMPAFHSGVMDQYQKVFAATFSGSRFTQESNTPFDMVEEFRVIAQVNMLVCLLGLDLCPSHLTLATRVTQVFDSMFSPLTMMFRWNRSWTPYGRWLRRISDTFEPLTRLIEQRRAEPPRPDALSVLCHTADEKGDRLTTSEIAGELHGLFAAGYETTASAMIWAMLTCLDQQDNAIEGLDHFINETQRIIPTVPVAIPRRVTRDIRIGEFIVPRRAIAIVSPLLEHRNADVFPSPHAFLPNRWKTVHPSPFGFFPFGIGQRRCIGVGFADLQVRNTIRMALERSYWRIHTARIDYTVKSGVMGLPRKPIYISSGRDQAPVPILSGSLMRLWDRGAPFQN